MNAINKMGQSSGKKAAGKAQGGNESGGKGVRTADTNPLDGLTDGGNEAGGGEATGGVNTSGGNASGGVNTSGGTNTSGGGSTGLGGRLAAKWNNAPKAIKGAASLAKNTVFTRKNLGRVGKAFGGAAGLTAGLVAGIASGDPSKALSYGAAGIAGGAAAGARLADAPFNIADSAIAGMDSIKYGYQEGALGKEAAKNAQFDREFKRSEDYKDMVKKYGEDGKDSINQMLAAGITDPARMNTILKGMGDHKMSVKQAIAYNQLANDCSDSVLYDNKKLREFLNKRNINVTEEKIDAIRKSIIDFK